MTKEDLLVLQSWAEGLCGANARLAKRAWLILENHRRKSPQLISGAWGDSKEAQNWIKSFHSLGLPGILDAPRAGRSRTYKNVEVKLSSLQNQDKKTDKKKVLEKLSKKEKEALWRLKRNKGVSFLRNRGGLDLEVQTTAALSDLFSLFITPHIQVLSTLSNSRMHLDELNGIWLQVDRRIKPTNGPLKNPQNLLAALKIKISRSEVSQAFYEEKSKKMLDLFISKTVECLEGFSTTYPKKLSVAVVVDIKGGEELVHFLTQFRKSSLFENQTDLATSNLKSFQVIPHFKNRAQTFQYLLAKEFEHSNQEELGELLDCISIKRKDYFCWIRKPDIALVQNESNWRKSELIQDE
jgi:hypothetical protein